MIRRRRQSSAVVVTAALAASCCVATSTFSASTVLAADPPPAANGKSPSDPAAAQALFYEARSLMKDGKYAIACPKLEESLRLDYGIGTEFNLADCNEKIGKIATAWSGFINVASAARTQNQPQREKVARDRAKALEPRLPKLTIEVSSSATPGLEVKRDGVLIGSASWGSAVPVDPGTHKITASAPGRQSWEGSVTVAEGRPAKITVPHLAADNRGAVAAAGGAAASGAAGATGSAPTTQDPAQANQGAAQSASTMQSFPEPVVERGGAQRAAGWVIAGVGLASVGVGAGFGINSLQKRERAKDHCEGSLCDAEGVSLRNRAITSGNVATITTIAGGAALVGGLILVLSAPHGRERATNSNSTATSTAKKSSALDAVVPSVGPGGGSLFLQGKF